MTLMTTSSSTIFAKLLATENISVTHSSIDQAYFDLVKRNLNLPFWNEPQCADMLIGHEVGHALFTPTEEWMSLKTKDNDRNDVPLSFYNVVEDIRIERMMQEKYPGLTTAFIRGYRVMKAKKIFGDEIDENRTHIAIEDYNFADRLNIAAKLRSLINVDFKPEEQVYIDMAHNAKTWSEVKTAAEAIYDFVKDEIDTLKNLLQSLGQCDDAGQSDGQNTEAKPSKGKSDEEGEEGEEGEQGKGEQGKGEQGKGDREATVSEQQDAEFSNGSSTKEEDDDDFDDYRDNEGDGDTDSDADGEGLDGDETSGADTEDGKAKTVVGGEASDQAEMPKYGTEGGHMVGTKGGVDPRKMKPEALELGSVTADEFDKNVSQNMVERHDNGKLVTISTGFNKHQIENTIIPYNRVKNARNQSLKPERELTQTFRKENKEAVATIAREFEMRKAAYMYARASTSKTGSLDMSRLHSYKHSEDIFLQTTKLAEAKNHGVVMVIDYSGSMASVIAKVLSQALQLAMFCEKTNIPFAIYGFGNGHGGNRNGQRAQVSRENASHVGCFTFELLSSQMGKKTYDEAFGVLVRQWAALDKIPSATTGYHYRSHYDKNALVGYESLQGTPLNESLIALHDICKKFRARHQIQKMTLVTLTDGDGNALKFPSGRPDKLYIHGKELDVGYCDDDAYYTDYTEALINNIRSLGYVDKIINFFLVDSYYSPRSDKFTAGCKSDDKSIINDYRTKQRAHMRKYGCTMVEDYQGYDLKIFIPGNSDALSGSSDEDLDLDVNESRSKQIAAFKKFAGSKKRNRIIASKIAEIIA